MNFLDVIKLTIVKALLGFRLTSINILQNILFNQSSNPTKILIHRIGTFGDSIVALPAIASIKKAFPNAKIDFVTTHATTINLSTIIQDGVFDEIYLISKKNRSTELKKLKQNNYDLFIDIPQKYGLYKSVRNMFLARFYLGIRSGFGWDMGITKVFAKTQMLFSPPQREVDRFLTTLEKNRVVPHMEFPLRITKPTPTDINTDNLDMQKTIAFCIGTNVPANEWNTANWSALAKLLTLEDYTIVLIGGKQEREKAIKIASVHTNIIDFCGKLSISESAYMLSKCAVSVCHDTGAMHLSYAVGIYTIAIMSTRQPYSKWAPPAHLGEVIIRQLECSGCFKTECNDNICINLITINDVLKSIKNTGKPSNAL